MSRRVIGVCGGSGSGKTTFTRMLVENGGGRVTVIGLDEYYRDLSHLTPEERAQVDFDSLEAIDAELLARHIDDLREGEAVEVPLYDFATHTRVSGGRKVEPSDMIVVEGITLLARQELTARLDHSVFIHVSEPIRFERRLSRDMEQRGRSKESVENQWEASVLPGHRELVDPYAALATQTIWNPSLDELSQWANRLVEQQLSRGT